MDFTLDRVSGVELAGIPLDRVRSMQDLGLVEAARLARAVAEEDLPLAFTLHVEGRNPDDNSTNARLTQMDWTLFLQDRETLSGIFRDEVVMPPGVPTDIPVEISVDLLDFFQGSAGDLLDLALSLTGQGGEPTDIALQATPTVNTALGPIRYPSPITIRHRVGGE